MTNSNLQSVIIRLSFRKGSTEIHAGLTKNNNITLVGEILHSSDLVVSHYNKLFEVDGNSCVGSIGTVCIADRDVANSLIEEINSIQAARTVNARGNRYPFVFLRVVSDGDIIFNRGVGDAPHRLSFLDVELIEVEADAPDEVVRIETPQVQAPSRSTYGTVRYRPQVKATLSAQTEAARSSIESPSPLGEQREIARAGLSSPSPTSHEAETEADSTVPTFNTKTIDVEEEGSKGNESEDSQDSQQDKLNAIAVAMKAAGMSGSEIAQALKAELELVF